MISRRRVYSGSFGIVMIELSEFSFYTDGYGKKYRTQEVTRWLYHLH